MKVDRSLFYGSSDDPTQAIKRVLENFSRIFSGNISFGATTSNTDASRNIDCSIATGTGGTANVEFSVAHNLQRVPIGFIVISLSQATTLYKGVTAWTAATNSAQGSIFIKDSVGATTFTIIVV